MLIEVIFDSGD